MRIFITGGHVTPAIAVIDELLREGKSEIFFFGRKYIGLDRSQPSMEYQLVAARKKVKFHNLTTGRLSRIKNISSITEIFKIPVGIILSIYYIFKYRPVKLLSFGGYLAFPMAMCCSMAGIEVFTHEQTIRPGLSNRIISFFCKKIFISFPQSVSFFNRKKVIITGNPVRKEVLQIIDKNLIEKIDKGKPMLFITGGSMGSHSVNLHIEKILSVLTPKFSVIHQCGNAAPYYDWNRLSKLKSKNYLPVVNISQGEIGAVWAKSSVVVCRAGANTIFELIALAKPAVVVPLPWSGSSEQLLHAQFLQKHGVAEIFDQDEDSNKLGKLIFQVHQNRKKYENNFETLTKYYKKSSASEIAKYILSV